ncbi:MAG: hypothetical protein HY913_08335 [Desulfomonile tiedjei]|nr:hypothetical protein [Desulfomonile tiedjei]
MKDFLKDVSLTYAAGSVGALANSLAAWLFGILGITAALGVQSAPALTAGFLYPRLVWGGLWGFLFLLPFLKGSVVARGIIYSLGPTAVQLLVVFPFKLGKGWLGLELGTLMPLFVILFNIVWGLCTAGWLVLLDEKGSSHSARH